jgi:TPR repeat protein
MASKAHLALGIVVAAVLAYVALHFSRAEDPVTAATNGEGSPRLVPNDSATNPVVAPNAQSRLANRAEVEAIVRTRRGLSESFDRLKALAASGNAHAAAQLAEDIFRCITFMDADAAMPQAITSLPQAAREEIEAFCANTQVTPGEGLSFAREAADAGIVEAQETYYLHALNFVQSSGVAIRNPAAAATYKADSLRFLNAAVAQGSGKAASTLSAIYFDGSVVDQDKVLAYVYYRLAAQGSTSSIVNAELVRRQSELTPAQLRLANSHVANMADHCCKR